MFLYTYIGVTSPWVHECSFLFCCTLYYVYRNSNFLNVYVLLAYAEISTPSPRQQDNEEDCELNIHKFKITHLKIIAVLVVKFRNKWLISQLYQSIVNKIQ